MSSKWRALQHRHRYTYTSVLFPKPFIQTLDSILLLSSPSDDFFPLLKSIASMTSTYAQISAAKDLPSSLTRLLASPDTPSSLSSAAAALLLEILFLENSLPLHRTLISALAKNRSSLPSSLPAFLASLCRSYSSPTNPRKRFSVSRAALSLMGFPKLAFLNDALEACSDLVAMDVAAGLAAVVSDVEGGSRPSPDVMEQCQDAMSCLYYLLQRYPSRFVGSEDHQSGAFQSVVRTILTVLKSPAFSRDCLVAAGVSFCAAVQACMSPAEVSSFIARGFFGFCSDQTGDSVAKKVLPGGDLYAEIREFSVLSRLCMLRGILTAIARPILNIRMTDPRNGSIWTVLYNGILPELCNYCENHVDSHFNFQSLTVTQICLQQIKTSLLANLTDMSGEYDPFPDDMVGCILRIIWNNLEDPLSQTVKQVHLIFDLLLDIISFLPSGGGAERTTSLISMISADLLQLGPRCKGRYVPLASLTKRLGAKHLLDLNPNLLCETTYAYVDDDICCAATSFLKCFLECLRDECWSRDGIEGGYDAFRGLCLPPLLQAIVSGHSKLRSNLNTYVIPTVLEVDTDSIFTMLGFIRLGPRVEGDKFNIDLKIDQCVAALVSLLKVSRILTLVEGDIELDQESGVQQKSSDGVAIVCVKGVNVRIPVEWFVLAVMHADESLRIDAAESLFLNPKTSSLPSSLELSLMREALPLNMRCCSTAFQMKWTSLFRKFFARVRTALERQMKQGSWQPITFFSGKENDTCDHTNDILVRRAEDLFYFVKWLSCFLLHSCYPSAPYERKTMAMELMLIMIDVWPTCLPQGNCNLHPYTEELTSPESTLSLLGSIVDSWDRLRESSFRILLCFPTPLPGISSHDSVIEVISWAKKLVCSPRVRESDAGALTLRLVFRKYVLELGQIVKVSDSIVCPDSHSELSNGDIKNLKIRIPVVEYISSLIEWLCVVVEEGEKDLSEACRDSFVHGVLLTLRYTFEELDWNSEVVQTSGSEMRCLLEKLLALIMRVTSLALWVVSADAWSMPYDMDDMVDSSSFLSDVAFEINTPESVPEPAEKILKSEDNDRPAEHVVMVGCWLAMKEVSLLLGTIIRKIPLPSYGVLDSQKLDYPLSNAVEMQTEATDDGMFDLQQLETIGNHFLQVLLKMKHNGAIDKTRAGFTALCNRLLCSNDPRLCSMTGTWMDQLMERTIAKGQTVDDLLRRSAGIPAAFIALFLSEPEGTPKKLLPKALRWLIDVANMSFCNICDVGSRNICENGNLKVEVLQNNLSEDLNEAPPATLIPEKNIKVSKIRDEGVIPTVHAFNVLRAAFNDTNLSADTSGFSAEALILSIRSFSSPYWEVRNSACLAYTALVRRMIGFLNVQKKESIRRALTGLEFFHRYPALHLFLFSELKVATELLGDGRARHMGSNMAKAIHPSLCPILIILSRLKPSLISSSTDDALDPFLFMPFIRRCATQSNLRVRVLASKALTGLVSNEKLHDVLMGVTHDLPHGRHQVQISRDQCATFSTPNGDEATISCSVSFNYIHGVLLQLSSLIDGNCRNLTDIAKKDQIVDELICLLLKCSWLGSISLCHCPTLNSAYLRVLDHLLSIARTYSSRHMPTIQSLLLELASECLDSEKYFGLLLNDPTKVELRRQAAASYFGCLFGRNPEASDKGFELQRFNPRISNLSEMNDTAIPSFRLQERIKSCISDSTYEVRVATLKRLLQMVKLMKSDDDGMVYTWARTYLQRTLVQLLAVEENPKCIYYILMIIFSWNILHFDKGIESQHGKTICVGLAYDSVYSLWHRLVHLNSTVMRAKTREILLCCMGICVKQFVNMLRRFVFSYATGTKEVIVSDSSINDQSNEWSKIYKCIHNFIILVKQHSAPSEPVNMRMAAAEAMVASGLLEEASLVASSVSNNHIPSEVSDAFEIEEIIVPQIEKSEVVNLYGSRILDLWFTCIQLLEDEDVGLRQKLANDVQKYIDSRGPKRHPSITSVPAQVEKVIESCFEFLTSIFGHWLHYVDYLSTWVLNAGSSVSSNGNLVRIIFDKEIDNHHEEKLLICQICCFHIEKLLVSKSWDVDMHSEDISESSLEMFFQRLRLRFLRQLISFANYLEMEGRANWIGGISNHKDAFLPLYVNLLGLYALTQCPKEGYHSSRQVAYLSNSYSAEFAKLIGIDRSFLRNPLISNLYFLVIQSHERFLRVSSVLPSTGDHSTWKVFDPYFLLR